MALFSNYDGQFSFSNIGQDYLDTPVFVLRLFPALTGTFIPLAMYAWLLVLGASVPAAALGGLFVLADNALLLQTRVIALDGLLVLASILSMLFMSVAVKKSDQFSRLPWLILSGISGGLAVGSKVTGLVALAMPVFILGLDFAMNFNWQRFLLNARGAAWFVIGAAAVYFGGWWLHFALLSQPGFGDAFYRPTGDFFTDMVRYQKIMLASNVDLKSTHPSSSSWWSWPLMLRGVFYWSSGNRVIYFLGNPVVWWGSTLLLVSAFCIGIFTKISSLRFGDTNFSWRSLVIPALAFAGSYLPYLGIKRALFMYHYLPPLVYAVAFSALWLDKIGFVVKGDIDRQKPRYYVLIVLAVVGFLLVLPITSGWDLVAYRDLVFHIFPGWR